MTTPTQRYDVLIIGGGPVGLALAVELGLRGVTCALVERHTSSVRIPKGQNLTQRTLEHFYFWGIEPELRAARVLPEGYPIGGITAYGNLTSDHWFAPPGREVVRNYYLTANERLPQYLMEEVLRARLEQIPAVTTLFGWSADAFEHDDNGARVTVSQIDGDGRLELEGEYLVACDGARSMVRDGLGIAMGGTDFGRRMVLAVFRSRDLHEGLKRFPECTTYRVLHPDLEGYWQFFGRIDVGEGWFFHAPVPADATTENFDLHAFLEKVAGFPMSVDFEYVGFWDLRIGIAERYRSGRVFIAGDAAHTHPPYGGFGLNSGLEDVRNLGWKLAAVLQGWGGPALLDSYEAERRPIMIETTDDVIKGGIEEDRDFLNRYRPDVDLDEFKAAWQELEATGGARQQTYEPHYEGSSAVVSPAGARPSIHSRHSYAAQAGHHLTPQPLSDGRNVFDALGPAYTLLALDAPDADVEAITEAARALHIPLEVVRDTFEAPRNAYESRLILIRPDQYVAWTANEAPKAPEALLRQVTGLT